MLVGIKGTEHAQSQHVLVRTVTIKSAYRTHSVQDVEKNGYPPKQTRLWAKVGVGTDQRGHVVAPLAEVLILPDP